MKQDEPYYRKPREESFQHCNDKAWGSMNGDTEQRILRLYNSGQSIDSITKEVGRARHVVVHVLQSKGVYGNGSTTTAQEESRPGAPIEEPKEEPELKAESVDTPTSKSLGKPKSPKNPGASAKPQPAVAPKTPVADRLSPPVLDALCQVAGQHDLSDMSLEEVRKLALRPKRSRV